MGICSMTIFTFVGILMILAQNIHTGCTSYECLYQVTEIGCRYLNEFDLECNSPNIVMVILITSTCYHKDQPSIGCPISTNECTNDSLVVFLAFWVMIFVFGSLCVCATVCDYLGYSITDLGQVTLGNCLPV